MQIDFLVPLKDITGKEFQDKTTLRDIAVTALISVYDDERNLDAKEKFTRGLLAQRIYGTPEKIDLTVEEVALVKKLIGKAYGPLIVVQAWGILDS